MFVWRHKKNSKEPEKETNNSENKNVPTVPTGKNTNTEPQHSTNYGTKQLPQQDRQHNQTEKERENPSKSPSNEELSKPSNKVPSKDPSLIPNINQSRPHNMDPRKT